MSKFDLVSNLQTAFKLYDKTLEDINKDDHYKLNELLNIAADETSLPIMAILRIIDVTNEETSKKYFLSKYSEKDIMRMIDKIHNATGKKINKEV